MKYFLVAIMMLTTFPSWSQYQFLAYRVTGTVTYLDNKKQYPLKVGKVLDQSKSVRVSAKSSLMLICNTSYTSIVLQEGTHQLDKITASCSKPDNSLTANYLNYVWWQFTHPKASAEEERKQNMTGPGAVSRGCPGISFMTPDTLNFYRENITLRWKVIVPSSRREFVLYTHENSPVAYLKRGVRNHFRLDSLAGQLETSMQYYWTLHLDGNETCPRQLIQVWGKEDFESLSDSLRKNIPAGLSMAEENYMMGFYMERSLFYGEAYRFYQKAAVAEPGNKRYKTTVKRFRELFGGTGK